MKEDDVKMVIVFVGMIFAAIVGIISCNNEKRDNEQYGRINYEFKIVDKYDKLGSHYHMVGGQRSSETEYHVIYHYRLTNRPNRDNNMIWYERDKEVPYTKYRRYKIGDTLKSNNLYLPNPR
jgi:hypothetical protein